jgi:hypothetical protein
MGRTLGYVIGAAMLLGTGAADAAMRAVYADTSQSKLLQIDVDDNGDARVGEAGSTNYGLLLGGQFYVVDASTPKPTVAKLKDIATAIDKVLPPIFKGLFDNPNAMPATHLKVQAGEFGALGGRKGQIYRIRGLDDSAPDKPTDFLISEDPELKPVGAALEQFMNAGVVPMAPLLGNAAAEMVAETHAIFVLGTPINVGGRFELQKADKATFPAGYFKLPAEPQTLDQLVASMKASMAKGSEEAPAK